MPQPKPTASKDVGHAALVRYLQFAGKQKRLTREEEKNLLERSRSGERCATDELVNANLFLVVAVSRSYADDHLSFMDRVAEGNVALIAACRRYLPGLDDSFRRYCLGKIRAAIKIALEEVASLGTVRPRSEWCHTIAGNDCNNPSEV